MRRAGAVFLPLITFSKNIYKETLRAAPPFLTRFIVHLFRKGCEHFSSDFYFTCSDQRKPFQVFSIVLRQLQHFSSFTTNDGMDTLIVVLLRLKTQRHRTQC